MATGCGDKRDLKEACGKAGSYRLVIRYPIRSYAKPSHPCHFRSRPPADIARLAFSIQEALLRILDDSGRVCAVFGLVNGDASNKHILRLRSHERLRP